MCHVVRAPISSRLRIAALIAACVSALGPAPPEDSVQRAVAEYMAQIEDPIAHGRLDPEWFDADAVRGELAERLRRGEDPSAVADWLEAATARAFLGFAPLDAHYDPRARYRLPYDEATPRLLSNGVGESETHAGPDRYSYDFAMPEGTPVLAARAGKVARVMDGYTRGGREAQLRNRSNTVLILHADGTFAEYGHLRPGIRVKVGRWVDAGEPLGQSGNTGYSGGPHLHFAVRLLDSEALSRTVPIRFHDAEGRSIRPEPGRLLP